MSSSQYRKLHATKELFHHNMIVIPYFYSHKPTNILAVGQNAIKYIKQNNVGDVFLTEKLYYKKNKPIKTTLASFQSVDKAIEFKNGFQEYTKRQTTKPTTKTNLCTYCKDITQFAKILFQPGSVYVPLPQTPQLKQIIDNISQMILMNGSDIQQKLKTFLEKQPILLFLNQKILSLENIYYRWRVYSYLQGDGDKKYRMEEFRIVRNGSVWYPPQGGAGFVYPVAMNYKEVKFFTESLIKMERRKYAIQQLMSFSIMKIDHAVQIVSIITLHLYQTLKQDFIGIFYLISDILFNSPTHIYRNLFQYILPFILYQYILQKQNDHNKQMNDKYYNQLKKLLQLWEKKYIFDENFIHGILFLLELVNVGKLLEVQEYPENAKIREIFGDDNYRFYLEKGCVENGIPFFQEKQEEAKLFLNALFWNNQQKINMQPELGKFDGESITQKQLLKIQSKNIKVVTCQGLPSDMVFQKNSKNPRSQSEKLSQDYSRY